MITWTYWEGDRLPYIETCLASFRRVCRRSQFILLTPQNLLRYLPGREIPDGFSRFRQPAHRADVIRALTLARYGGLWCDADSLMLQDPQTLLDDYPDASVIYSSWTNPPLRVMNGYVYSHPQRGCAREWAEGVCRVLSDGFDEESGWGKLGEGVLTPLVPAWPGAVRVPVDTFLPVEIDREVEEFFRPTTREGQFWELLQEHTVAIGLNHSYFLYHHGPDVKTAPARWHKSNLMIHRMLSYVHLMNTNTESDR